MRWISVAGLITVLAVAAVVAPGMAPVTVAKEGTPASGTLELAPGVVAEEMLIPAGEPAIFRIPIEPGAAVAFDDTDPSLSLVLVERGALTATFQGPISVTGAGAGGAPDEPVAAGAELTAGVGDSFVAPANTAVDQDNAGAEGVTLLIATLVPAAGAGSGTAAGTPKSDEDRHRNQ